MNKDGNDNNGGVDRIPNCRKCEYNNNSKLICIECKSDYILKDDEKNICYNKTNYDYNNSYYKDTLFHIKTCSKNLSNYEECKKNSMEH